MDSILDIWEPYVSRNVFMGGGGGVKGGGGS